MEIFADEGLSGMNAQNRTEFQRMIKMCEQHQIDLIVTKSVSRFARNAKESLEYVRKLKLLGVGVQFEKEGIYTLAGALLCGLLWQTAGEMTSMLAGAGLVFAIRCLSAHYRWNLPKTHD